MNSKNKRFDGILGALPRKLPAADSVLNRWMISDVESLRQIYKKEPVHRTVIIHTDCWGIVLKCNTVFSLLVRMFEIVKWRDVIYRLFRSQQCKSSEKLLRHASFVPEVR